MMKKYGCLAVLCARAWMPAVQANELRDVAPNDGWAAMQGGTSGGSQADASHVFTVRHVDELIAVLKKNKDQPKLIQVVGVIDAKGGQPFASRQDQAARGQIRLPANTTLIGVGADAGFVSANLVVRNVDNVIIRNLQIETPWDEYPEWDPNDGPSGHWNSEYDGISIDQSRHVWVDHVRITDGQHTDDQNGHQNGQEVQHHDGALDIKNGSDFITVSYSVFDLHDKTNLIGHSDNKTSDAGHLTITFHHNIFQDVTQRAPRVRYGQVHLYNNYYVGDKKHPVYPLSYSHGVGVEAQMISENNLFVVKGAKSACDVVRSFGGNHYQDQGSVLNGEKLDLAAGCKDDKGRLVQFDAAGWKPPYPYTLQPSADLAAQLKSLAGPH